MLVRTRRKNHFARLPGLSVPYSYFLISPGRDCLTVARNDDDSLQIESCRKDMRRLGMLRLQQVPYSCPIISPCGEEKAPAIAQVPALCLSRSYPSANAFIDIPDVRLSLAF